MMIQFGALSISESKKEKKYYTGSMTLPASIKRKETRRPKVL